MQVFKFGGASLRDAAAIRNVATILEKYQQEELLVVVSAIGKTTNALEKVAEAYHRGLVEEARTHLYEVRDAHLIIVAELFDGQLPEELGANLNDLIVSVEWALEDPPNENYDYDYDQIVSLGELMSSHLVAAYLNHRELTTRWLDARDVIITDNIYREGWVQWPATQERATKMIPPLFKDGAMVLTQGFIGSTTENFTTTLGREGSDYTAAIFSYCLDAERMSIWKDVPGVLTADPRKFDNVSKLDRLSYKEAIEMTYYGAKVIHPKTIKPLQNKNIPLYVRSFLEPDASGTLVSSEVEEAYPPLVAIEDQQALVHISTRDFSFVAEHHIKELFEQVTELRLQVNMMQNRAISFNMVFNDVDDKVDRFCQSIDANYKTMIDRDLELITVRHYTPEVVESLRKGKIVKLEARLPATLQMVVKDAPVMSRKSSDRISQ
ncbi:aspartate kinase [Lewinellaceae bacterium SD302]|nr:aspartate kinase [Lewinellaceae bacterium SD302]